MKSLVFDTGPIISLTTNNALWIVEPLRRYFGGKFYIPRSVKKELVDRPLLSRRFKFQALQVLDLVSKDILETIHNDQILRKAKQLQHMANSLFKAQGNWITLVHFADMETLSAALFLNADAVVFDERTTRILLEDPSSLHEYLEKKLHTTVTVHYSRLREFRKAVKGIRVIRSVELITGAYELGLFDPLIHSIQDSALANPSRTLLESVLWGMKLSGCSVSREEIATILSRALCPTLSPSF